MNQHNAIVNYLQLDFTHQFVAEVGEPDEILLDVEPDCDAAGEPQQFLHLNFAGQQPRFQVDRQRCQEGNLDKTPDILGN